MTLIVCAKGIDGMVFASDSRGTFGDPRGITARNDTMRKIFKLNNQCILLMSGSAELGETILEEIQRQISTQKLKNIDKVVECAVNKFRAKYNEWFPQFQPNQRPMLGIIIGGYEVDKKKKQSCKPKIFSMMSPLNFAPGLHNYGFALHGVPQYALYLLNTLYSDRMKINQLKQLLAYVITETASQDGKVGGPIQMAVLKKDDCTILSRKEIERIIKRNEANKVRLRKLFFGEKKHGKKGKN
ncbi:MAG: hypothetical protein ABIH20_01830 [Candidatus Diapherotrites archaeon]